MKRALLGYTGYVGTTLLRQCEFHALYNSHNVEEIAGRHFDVLVCAAAPGKKWLANQQPAEDLAALGRLQAALSRCTAARVVLISTVDVYPNPVGVDETSPINRALLAPYGLHRLQLEDFMGDTFEKVHVMRLPALFGRGLKKNFIYDLLHDNCLELTDSRSQLQFYDLERLWTDCKRVMEADAALMNVATAPVDCATVAERCFGRPFTNTTERGPVVYDVQTTHAPALGGDGRYVMDAEAVLQALVHFVSVELKCQIQPSAKHAPRANSDLGAN